MPPIVQSPESPQSEASPGISPFADLLGLKTIDAKPGFARLGLMLDERLNNMAGLAHGGVLFSLMDTACAVALNTDDQGNLTGRSVTLSFSTQFLRPAKSDSLVAAAEVIGGGRETAMLNAVVRDSRDRVIATGHGTFKRLRA